VTLLYDYKNINDEGVTLYNYTYDWSWYAWYDIHCVVYYIIYFYMSFFVDL